MVPIGKEKELITAVQRQMVECEMVTVKGALRNFLQREPTNDDAVLCGQILSDPWDGTYVLTYNGEKLGTVKYIYEPEKFRVEFYPLPKQN